MVGWSMVTIGSLVRLGVSLAFSIFQIKMEPINSHFLAILGKKGTFRNQWQSLINSRLPSPEFCSFRSYASYKFVPLPLCEYWLYSYPG